MSRIHGKRLITPYAVYGLYAPFTVCIRSDERVVGPAYGTVTVLIVP